MGEGLRVVYRESSRLESNKISILFNIYSISRSISKICIPPLPNSIPEETCIDEPSSEFLNTVNYCSERMKA